MPGLEPFLDDYIPGGGDVALDVGANRGAWSAYLAQRFDDVYAVEPTPALHDALRVLAPNVTLLPFAAWSVAERRTFTQFAHDANTSGVGGWTGIMAGPVVGSFEAECLPIDVMPIDGHVGFIKIDTEGAEVEVVRGAEQTILHDRPRIIIEVHTAANGAELARMFDAIGYRLTLVRHPYYAPGDPWRQEHYWLICEPA